MVYGEQASDASGTLHRNGVIDPDARVEHGDGAICHPRLTSRSTPAPSGGRSSRGSTASSTALARAVALPVSAGGTSRRHTMTALYRRSTLGLALAAAARRRPGRAQRRCVFGGMLGRRSRAAPPYFLFFLCGTTTWMLFERSLLFVTRSLEQNRKLITKVYFPAADPSDVRRGARPAVPRRSCCSCWSGRSSTTTSRTASGTSRCGRELLVVGRGDRRSASSFTVAVGLWTSVLQARYRDIRYGLRYVMPFWMYFTPVIYPLSHDSREVALAGRHQPDGADRRSVQVGHARPGRTSPRHRLVTSLSLIALTMVSGMWFFNREEAASIDKL